jgi:MerR family transcriptional regulator, copper efflux regulator
MRIGIVTKLFGVTASKVRFLEARGLLHPGRTPGGYRHYNETAVERLSFILQAQSFGFTIEELRRFFAESGSDAFRCEFVIEHMTKKLDELGRNIDRACAMRDRLLDGINDVKARVQRREHQTTMPLRRAMKDT